MNSIRFQKLSFLLFFITLLSFSQKKPNIIIIYTDDQGAGDISALNSEARFKTPNLDLLVNEGVAFTNGHSASSVCTPSRYGLLTGRYPWRTKLKKGVMRADKDCLIPDSRLTLASLLKQNGYNTAMVGKWHLGMQIPGETGDRDWSKPIEDMPLDKGFDYFYGVPASLNFGVLAWFEGRYTKTPPTLFTSKKKNDRHVDYRIMPPYGTSQVRKNIEVAPDFIDNQCLTRFTDKAIAWMDGKLSETKKGKPFFLYLPYTSPHYPVCPLPEFHGQGKCGAYGEFMIETDHHIGRILSFLKKSGIDDNTLIVFTSDNGPEKSWEARITEFNHDSKGGFKGGKRSVYEGGHRVPFLARWPKGIKNPGRIWKKPVGQVDLLATFADLLNFQIPDNDGEDSQSFADVLTNKNSNHERLPIINQGNGKGDYRYAITEGYWKLIMPDKTRPVELYYLLNDPKEAINIVSSNSQRVEKMTKQINQIIINGRTTIGETQKNDTGYWKELSWLTEEQYKNKIN